MAKSSQCAPAGRSLTTDDRGIGLPELLVAMMLLAIMMTLVISAFSSFSSSFTRDRAATDSTAAAAIAMNELTRVIRSGTEIPPASGTGPNTAVFLEATGTSVTLHAYLDTDSTDPRPVKVMFFVNTDGDLRETRWEAIAGANKSWSFPNAANYTRVIARQLIAPAGEAPLFTYIMSDKTAVTSVDASLHRSIAAVELNLIVQADGTGRADPVNITNRVGMPNLGVSRIGP